MELHLHLSVAFRGLDRKWGKPVDLASAEVSYPCLPAAIERATTTFSSEEYLTTRRPRPTPYSCPEDRRRRKENVKRNDSFANISSSRFPSVSDLNDSRLSLDTNEESDNQDKLIQSLVEDIEKNYMESTVSSLEAEIQRRKNRNIFLQLKDSAKSYINKKCRTKMTNLCQR